MTEQDEARIREIVREEIDSRQVKIQVNAKSLVEVALDRFKLSILETIRDQEQRRG